MKIDIVPCLSDNYSYVMYDKESNLVAVIDPSNFKSVDDHISRKYKRLDYIFNTHHHFDHTGGNLELKKKYNAKIAASQLDKNKINNIDIFLTENSELNFGNVNFKILLTPGHTKGHIAFYSKKEKIIFTGDTLFSLGCGRIFEGTYKEMFNSLNKIKKLPKDTKIYCGHEYTAKNYEFCFFYEPNNKKLKEKKLWIDEKIKNNTPTVPTTLENECDTNIFLRCADIALKKRLNMDDSSDEDIFQKLRNLKDEF